MDMKGYAYTHIYLEIIMEGKYNYNNMFKKC